MLRSQLDNEFGSNTTTGSQARFAPPARNTPGCYLPAVSRGAAPQQLSHGTWPTPRGPSSPATSTTAQALAPSLASRKFARGLEQVYAASMRAATAGKEKHAQQNNVQGLESGFLEEDMAFALLGLNAPKNPDSMPRTVFAL